MNISRKLKIVSTVVLTVIALFSLILLISSRNLFTQRATPPTPENRPAITEDKKTMTSPVGEIVDVDQSWSTYSSKNLGIVMRYPKSWTVDQGPPFMLNSNKEVGCFHDGGSFEPCSRKASLTVYLDMNTTVEKVFARKFRSEVADSNLHELKGSDGLTWTAFNEVGLGVFPTWITQVGPHVLVIYTDEVMLPAIVSDAKNVVKAVTLIPDTINWRQYENKELGLRFRYPENLPAPDIQLYVAGDSPKFTEGKSWEGDLGDDGMYFSAHSADFASRRGASFLDVRGFYQEGNRYFLGEEVQPQLVIDRPSLQAIIVDTNSYLLPVDGPHSRTGYGAAINLKGNVFPGMVVQLFDEAKISRAVFNQIIESMETFQPQS